MFKDNYKKLVSKFIFNFFAVKALFLFRLSLNKDSNAPVIPFRDSL